jgi:hypothetical protein
MSGLTIEALGITKEEAAERVIERLTQSILYNEEYDEDGNPFRGESSFRAEVDKAIKARINEEVNRLGDIEIGPRVAALVEGVTMQETNSWGEKTGEALTFREYLVKRAEAYMVEPVDYNGKSKDASNSYGFSAKSTRVAYMIDKHLHWQIENAMKDALGQFNGTLGKGLMEAVRLALNSALAALKVEVKTK